MIQADQLVKEFNGRKVVCGVSFEVGRGVLGFLGPNGAGKTTTMRMITGFLPPTSGTARVTGLDVGRNTVQVQRNLGYLPENAPMYMDMTVEGFLRFIAEIRGFSGTEAAGKVDAVIEKTLLGNVRHQTIDTLSKGYKQRTAFAQAILHDPPVLILDEPTEGLDPNQKQVVRDMIRQMASEKVIVLSTHVLEEVEAICDRVIIISDGTLVADDSPDNLKRQSHEYNAVEIDLPGDVSDVESTLGAISGVASVKRLDGSEELARYRLFASDQNVIAPAVIDAAATKQWPIAAIRTLDGRLDEVFRKLTTTADTQAAAGAEE